MSGNVLLRDLAAEVGGDARAVALLDRVGAKVIEDPLGRLVVGEVAARAAVDAAEREQLEELQLTGIYNAWAAERTARRQAVARDAYEQGFAEARQAQVEVAAKINSGEIPSGYATGSYQLGPPDQSVRVAAREAMHAALREFDAAEPDPGYADWRSSKAGRKAARQLAKATD